MITQSPNPDLVSHDSISGEPPAADASLLFEAALTASPDLVDGSERRNDHASAPVRTFQKWWVASIVVGCAATVFSWAALTDIVLPIPAHQPLRGLLFLVTHLPALVILFFLTGGLIERIGFFRRGKRARQAGPLPDDLPTVCVQLPMFNEEAVARRAIEAAGALQWPRDKLTIQILDDSTDAEARAIVDEAAANVRRRGINCQIVRRTNRYGYKAGALEAARHTTSAEFTAIFDADFIPPPDFLKRAIGHFYQANGEADPSIALVQAQWGHLNHNESALTRAQSLWVDDHHTLQMSWRSEKWRFVNFTGTAGIWRSAGIEEVGGWQAASLVEDCELSFRHLFHGFRTVFVKEIVAPAELPNTFTAYKAQQKRWTQGWVQLQRLHLRTLAFEYKTSPIRRVHLLYHMLISWQWPVWALWLLIMPALIKLDLWFGSYGLFTGFIAYFFMPAIWLIASTLIASVETRHTYPTPLSVIEFVHRFSRIVPYLIISTGMLAHQFSAFMEGLFAPLHSEFERTPKTAAVSSISQQGVQPSVTQARKRPSVKIHWPYVLAEVFFIGYQLIWAVEFALTGLWWPALSCFGLAGSVLILTLFYGDHEGKILFLFDRKKIALRLFGMQS